jgi:hypothetical protein
MSTYRNPIAHSADPESSHAAAREVTDSGARDTHCAVVLDAVKAPRLLDQQAEGRDVAGGRAAGA